MIEKPRKYATATAFRRALEDRLRLIAEKEKLTVERLRRELAFDRLLARLFSREQAPWVLKGGYALELRIKEARVTKDLDLALRETLGKGKSLNDSLFAALEEASKLDLADYFAFVVGPIMQDLDGAPYGGARFPVEARMDNRTFVEFHIDIGSGDVLMMPLDVTEGHDWLEFAGISAAKHPTICREQHFSEKVHAYTVPRNVPNSRVRDLVDMVLLIRAGLNSKKVAEAIAVTFKRRNTHPVPKKLTPPPAAWTGPFVKLAEECGLPTAISSAYGEVERFLATL